MARVYGAPDDLSAQYAKTCLEQSGLHPVLFYRAHPYGGLNVVSATHVSAGDHDGHIINEIKLMVPCQDVPEAEHILKSLDVLPSKDKIA
jgi:hypothetical protein